MAKVGMINRESKRQRLTAKYKGRRTRLLEVARNQSLSWEERFEAQRKLSELPRNSAANRGRRRCQVTGRPRGYFGKFGLCRNQLRELASVGAIPGLVKASW